MVVPPVIVIFALTSISQTHGTQGRIFSVKFGTNDWFEEMKNPCNDATRTPYRVSDIGIQNKTTEIRNMVGSMLTRMRDLNGFIVSVQYIITFFIFSVSRKLVNLHYAQAKYCN